MAQVDYIHCSQSSCINEDFRIMLFTVCTYKINLTHVQLNTCHCKPICLRLITDLAVDTRKTCWSTAHRDCHCPAPISDIHSAEFPLHQQPEATEQKNTVMSSAWPLGDSVRNIVSAIKKKQCADAIFLFLVDIHTSHMKYYFHVLLWKICKLQKGSGQHVLLLHI